MSIRIELAFSLEVHLAPPIEIGTSYSGDRRVIPIVGGTVSSPKLNGEILPGGADWNVVRSDTVVHLWARYTVKTDDGENIMVTNEGLQRGPADTMESILSGKPFEIGDWYARTRPVFEVGDPKYAWLNQPIFIGNLLPPRHADRVSIDIYEVL